MFAEELEALENRAWINLATMVFDPQQRPPLIDSEETIAVLKRTNEKKKKISEKFRNL